MAKRNLPGETSETQPARLGLTIGYALIFGGLSIALILAAVKGYATREGLLSLPTIKTLEAFLLALFLSMTIERCLYFGMAKNRLRYRMAFLISASTLILIGIINWLPGDLAGNVGWVCLSSLGAFIGGLIVTGINEHLWENNSPPPEDTQAEVLRIHQEVIGEPNRTPPAKRLFDIALSFGGLILATPIWLTSAFLIWLEDPGPILFVKNSVGKGGRNFRQLKFRTMIRGAEEATGPVWASENDQRVLRSGRLLRKTALDELPQLINILGGEMSFVGPRPQRTVLVHGYLQTIPEYAQRHQVAPGLAGLAQVAGDYYLTPRQKLRFDQLYIKHSNLGFDLRLIFLAFSIAFWFRWQKGWNGKLPRRLLHR